MPKYGILVDMSSCLGCKACALSCKFENGVPTGVSWLKVEDEVLNVSKGVQRFSFPMACLHCGEPSCVKVCPTGAITKETDGTVQRNPEKCVGCKYCISACPFGQSSFDNVTKKAEKCNLCKDRQARGEAPACTVNCPVKARVAIAPDKLKEEAEKHLAQTKKLGLNYTLFTGQNVGGTLVAYLVPEGVSLKSGPEGKAISSTVGVWQDVIKPVAKVGLGGVVGAVAIAGVLNARKKEED